MAVPTTAIKFLIIFLLYLKNVVIDPTSVELQSGESRDITLQIQAPTTANPDLLPLYSGFIYATDSNTGKAAHLSCKNFFLV